jgi:glycosyltransferase involved in cell wall biosynthesis
MSEVDSGLAQMPFSGPVLTVVMPSFNAVAYIEQSVRSVLDQSGDEVDLVVMDGLSSDGTQQVLARLQHRYPGRLRWFSQKDTGPAQAINRALSLVTSRWVGWLNADDLYVPGTLQQVLIQFDKRPDWVMVYGLAKHIDGHGKLLGAYPTRPPQTLLSEMVNGSGLCQPAAFMQREALLQVGPLDESLQTAFDYDWWWRWFSRYPQQIGFVRRVWAHSRLHAACLTQRLRKTVALEGMRVVTRHAGTPPVHWFWTHVDEIMAGYPHSMTDQTLLQLLQAFVNEVREIYPDDVVKTLLKQLQQDRRLALAGPGLIASVEPDGWVGKRLQVRYRSEQHDVKAVLLHCAAAWPTPGRMRLRVSSSHGALQYMTLDVPSEFVLCLDVPATWAEADLPCPAFAQWDIEAHPGFIPAEHHSGSTDMRRLGFRVLSLRTTTDTADA